MPSITPDFRIDTGRSSLAALWTVGATSACFSTATTGSMRALTGAGAGTRAYASVATAAPDLTSALASVGQTASNILARRGSTGRSPADPRRGASNTALRAAGAAPLLCFDAGCGIDRASAARSARIGAGPRAGACGDSGTLSGSSTTVTSPTAHTIGKMLGRGAPARHPYCG